MSLVSLRAHRYKGQSDHRKFVLAHRGKSRWWRRAFSALERSATRRDGHLHLLIVIGILRRDMSEGCTRRTMVSRQGALPSETGCAIAMRRLLPTCHAARISAVRG